MINGREYEIENVNYLNARKGVDAEVTLKPVKGKKPVKILMAEEEYTKLVDNAP